MTEAGDGRDRTSAAKEPPGCAGAPVPPRLFALHLDGRRRERSRLRRARADDERPAVLLRGAREASPDAFRLLRAKPMFPPEHFFISRDVPVGTLWNFSEENPPMYLLLQ